MKVNLTTGHKRYLGIVEHVAHCYDYEMKDGTFVRIYDTGILNENVCIGKSKTRKGLDRVKLKPFKRLYIYQSCKL